jgi:hypothetical protein
MEARHSSGQNSSVGSIIVNVGRLEQGIVKFWENIDGILVIEVAKFR